MKTVKGKFYVQYPNETTYHAIAFNPNGHDSIESAILFETRSGIGPYVILNDKLEVVYPIRTEEMSNN